MGITYQEWLKKKSKKYSLRKKRRKKYNPYKKQLNNLKQPSKEEGYYNIGWGECIKEAPTVFSFIYNTDATIEYFFELINEIKTGHYKQTFYIDSKNVSNVTIDVLVYIIGIIQNIKNNRINKYTFKGNLPQLKSAKNTYFESGFFNYVRSQHKELPQSTEKMQIVTGKITDQEIAKKMCMFVMDKLGEDKIFTNNLYKTLIELMSNAVHHAYTDNEVMYPSWYIYAEYLNDKVQFIFVDTGLGIANTVRKNFWEIVRIKKNYDSDLIESAFNGEFRTETKKKNRGLGLPAIKKFVLNGTFNNFFVLSGKGSYKLNKDNGKNKFTKIEHNYKIYGTLYSFQIESRGK